MQWWNDIVDWFYSDEGQQLILTVVVPALAIIVAGIIGAWIGRAATKRLVAQRDRETRASAVAALVTAGTHAATWHSQTPAAKDHSQQLAAAADISVRLMPIPGAVLAADWAAHELADMRINSVNYGFQAEQSLREYRERLVQWVHHPRRAKKLFGQDLQRWEYEGDEVDPVVAEQQRWVEERTAAARAPEPYAAPAADPGPASPASAGSSTPAASAAAASPASPAAPASAPATPPDGYAAPPPLQEPRTNSGEHDIVR